MKKYEYLYILDPQEENARKTIDALKDQYQKLGALISKEEEMGKRHLSYEIKKKADGFYYLTQIEIEDPTKLKDFERELKLNPNVIRYMKIRI